MWRVCVTAEPKEHPSQHPGDFGAGMHRRKSPSHAVLPEPPCCTFDSQTSARVPPHTSLWCRLATQQRVQHLRRYQKQFFLCCWKSLRLWQSAWFKHSLCLDLFLPAEISHFFNLRVACAEKLLGCVRKPPFSFCQSWPSVCISSVIW